MQAVPLPTSLGGSRPEPHPRRRLLLSAGVALLGLLHQGAAISQVITRFIPEAAEPGVVSEAGPAGLVIDARIYPFSPAAIVRDDRNLIVLPSSIPARSRVRFLLDHMGQIHRVWILDEHELARLDAARASRQRVGPRAFQ